MNEIKVTVELSEKAENLLTAILHELCRLPGGEITIHDERPQMVEKTAEPEEPKAEAPAQSYELGDVMAKVQMLIKVGKKEECRDIVQAFAPSVSAIPVDKFGDVMARLSELEEGGAPA